MQNFSFGLNELFLNRSQVVADTASLAIDSPHKWLWMVIIVIRLGANASI